MDNLEIIGTAQLRKVTAANTTMQLLELAAKLAEAGYDKKLWSLLSRVYEDSKGFGDSEDTICDEAATKLLVSRIMNTNMPAEYKMQVYTSFAIPKMLAPDSDVALKYIAECSKKRSNIAGFFIIAYGYEISAYKNILENKDIFKVIAKYLPADRLLSLYEHIIDNENKEYITGAIRTFSEQNAKVRYSDNSVVKRVTEKVFQSKEVFFTTKLLFCEAFNVPKSCLPENRELYKILKISINYEERITKEFVRRYNIDFDISDEAMCKYYINNKKATNQKAIVTKFANHIVRVEDEGVKKGLLRSAFKRGGYFRMYAGCMQDGEVIVEKQKKFRYSDEDIEWCSGLAGLKKD